MSVYFFSKRGLRSVAPFLTPGTLLAFDFDGTLAPISHRPQDAALPTPLATLLKRLSDTSPVVLISGRSLLDLRGRVPEGLFALVGNHGAEGLAGHKIRLETAARIVGAWERSLLPLIETIPGVKLENKGYSISIHFRASRRRGVTRRILLSLVNTLKISPRVIEGKCVLNLVPPGQPHKGDALLRLMGKRKFRRAIFVGDDDTDEDVFSLRDPRIFSLRVGKNKASAAPAFLRNQREMHAFLKLLLRESLRR